MKKASLFKTKWISVSQIENSKLKNFVMAFAVMALSSQSLACLAPAPEHTVAWQELVQRTKNIVVAEVVDAKPVVTNTGAEFEGNTLYKLKVIESLKGPAAVSKGLQIVGNPPPRKVDNDFTAHQETGFWKENAGRTIVAPDCSLRPSLAVGAKYLLFVDKPYHVKSFEKIAAPDDRWLEKVRAEIKNSATAPSPSSSSSPK